MLNEAIKCYDKSTEINPQIITVWNNKGIALFNLGRCSEAIACFDKALKLDSTYALAEQNKAIAANSCESKPTNPIDDNCLCTQGSCRQVGNNVVCDGGSCSCNNGRISFGLPGSTGIGVGIGSTGIAVTKAS